MSLPSRLTSSQASNGDCRKTEEVPLLELNGCHEPWSQTVITQNGKVTCWRNQRGLGKWCFPVQVGDFLGFTCILFHVNDMLNELWTKKSKPNRVQQISEASEIIKGGWWKKSGTSWYIRISSSLSRYLTGFLYMSGGAEFLPSTSIKLCLSMTFPATSSHIPWAAQTMRSCNKAFRTW